MALKQIKKEDLSSEDLKGILLSVDNGDLEALETIKKKWSFKSNESVLRFALAVIAQAESQILYIDKGGNKVALKPNVELLDTPAQNNSEL